MKKVLFFMFTLIFGFSIASAKKVEISVDFDYTDSNTFNFFYEVHHDTEFSKFLSANNDMLALFYKNYSTALSDVYADLSGDKRDYSIYFVKTDNHYFVNMIYHDTYDYLLSIEYDENMNLVKANDKTSYSFRNISFNPVKRDNRLECYEFFAFWQGSHNYYISGDNSYTLNRYYVDGVSYINYTDDDSIWRTILKSWAATFEGGHYTDDLDVGLNLEYFKFHQIASKYTELGYMRNIFFNYPNYDLSNYSYFYLNEVEQGIFLVPRYTNDEVDNVDFNLYLSSPDENVSTFLSTALTVEKRSDNEECTESCNYVVGENYDYLNRDYNFSRTILKLNLTNFYSKVNSSNSADFVYHFFTTAYNNDVILYYNSAYWDVLVPGSGTASHYRHNDTVFADKIDAVKSWDKVNDSVGGVLGSFGNINKDYSGSSSNTGGTGGSGGSSNTGGTGSSAGSLADFTNKYSPSNIFESFGSVISMMGLFITEFLSSMPKEISYCLTFFLPISLAIGIYKILKG